MLFQDIATRGGVQMLRVQAPVRIACWVPVQAAWNAMGSCASGAMRNTSVFRSDGKTIKSRPSKCRQTSTNVFHYGQITLHSIEGDLSVRNDRLVNL